MTVWFLPCPWLTMFYCTFDIGGIDGSLSLTGVFLLFSQPYVLRPARMEETVHLQTHAVVLMVGLGTLAVKVCAVCV